MGDKESSVEGKQGPSGQREEGQPPPHAEGQWKEGISLAPLHRRCGKQGVCTTCKQGVDPVAPQEVLVKRRETCIFSSVREHHSLN